uniref:C-type lectin domain-containing protein n=1 Tax=Salarias fasciatus TaxID=181472 RepID=A0A672ILT3_SALFA
MFEIVFGFGLISCSDVHHQKYHYVDRPMTWAEAQRYCRQFYYDLATFESMEDMDQLNRPSSMTSAVWIGLWDDPKSWKATLKRSGKQKCDVGDKRAAGVDRFVS